MIPATKYTFVSFVKKPDETLASVIDGPAMSLSALGSVGDSLAQSGAMAASEGLAAAQSATFRPRSGERQLLLGADVQIS
jgi:hypothetical protein